VSWTSTGWTNGRNVERMLRGELMIEGVFDEEGCAGDLADRPVTAAIESLASFAGAGSVGYSGAVAVS